MKGLVATIALAASTSTEGQNVNVIRREGEDTNGSSSPPEHLEQYQKSENVMQNTPLLPEEDTLKSKAESDVGVLSNNKEGVSIDNPRGQSFLDTPQYNQEVTRQGRRRLDDDDATTFQDRCVASSFEKFGTDYSTNPLDSYVDCVDGFVRDTTTGLATSQTCGDACGFVNETSYKCCAGIDRDYSANPDPAELSDACEGFTGKVCKDGSCSSSKGACTNATIDYVSGPSCRGGFSGGPNSCKDATIGSLYKSCEDGGSCYNATIGTASKSCLDGNSCKNAIIGNAASSCENGNSCPGANIGNATLSCLKSRACEDATIGSVESSCTLSRSCRYAQLSGVDLIDSCQAEEGADSNRYGCCQDINGDGVITELIGCCNEVEQCRDEVGYGIYEAGCPAPTSMPSQVPSQSSAPSTSFMPSSSPTKSGKGSGKSSSNSEKSGKGKSSKVGSRNMASKSDVLAYLTSSEVTPDEKKAFVLAMIAQALERLTDELNED